MDSGDEDIQRQVQVKASIAMLLEKGNMVSLGGPSATARAYNQLNFSGALHERGTDHSRPGVAGLH